METINVPRKFPNVCDILRPQKLDDFPAFGEVEITKIELNRTSDKRGIGVLNSRNCPVFPGLVAF